MVWYSTHTLQYCLELIITANCFVIIYNGKLLTHCIRNSPEKERKEGFCQDLNRHLSDC